MIKKIMVTAFLLAGTMSESSVDGLSTCCSIIGSKVTVDPAVAARAARYAATTDAFRKCNTCVCVCGGLFTSFHLGLKLGQIYKTNNKKTK